MFLTNYKKDRLIISNLGHNSQNKKLFDFVIGGTESVKITDQIIKSYLNIVNGISKN